MVEGHASGVLTHLQSVMAQRVMNIAHVTLANVMIPMAKVVKADGNIGEESLRRLIGEQNHSRLPLIDAAGQVAGIVDIYDVLAAEGPVDLANLASKPLVLPADLTITEALYRMQRAGASMAVVADAGRHGGIVTIKDLVGQIVGELEAW